MSWSDLWSQRDLWWDAMLVGTLCGGVSGYLGLWIRFHRISFFTLTLTQVASLGILVSFWISEAIPPLWGAWMATLFYCGLLSFQRTQGRPQEVGIETLNAVVFVFALGLVLAMGQHMPQKTEEMTQILYGTSVKILPQERIPVIFVLLLAIYLFRRFHHRLVAITFDSGFERAFGTSIFGFQFLLFVGIGLVIGSGTKVIGALPVFTFTIFPAMAALYLTQSLSKAFQIAIAMGASCYPLGYIVSYFGSIPLGAAISFVGFVFFVLGWSRSFKSDIRQLLKQRKSRFSRWKSNARASLLRPYPDSRNSNDGIEESRTVH